MRGTQSARSALLLLPVLLVVGCDRGMDRDTVARAGDFQLQVDEAARMVAPTLELPAEGEVVEAVADFWIDYTLLAWAVNQQGELAELDLSPLLQQQTSQELVMRLRDEVIQVDTALTDEELREIFETDRPGDEVHARHILLSVPDGADQAQRDSTRELAEDIRDRARAGEDFEELAQEHSEDPGSAGRGGDLGYFGRGQMVPPFEEAAFSLEPGEISDVVESDFGFHVIQVEDRRSPTFEDVAGELRQQLQMEWTMQAESLFVARLEDPADIRIQEGAVDRLREIAEQPEADLGGRADDELVAYEEGAYTEGEYRAFLLAQPPELRQQVQMATDDQLEGLLQDLTRDELLVTEARRRGIEIDPAELSAFEEELVQQYRLVADFLGLTQIEPSEGESMEEAVDRQVKQVMARVVSGDQEIVPLAGLTLPLRQRYETEVAEGTIDRVVSRIDELRAEGFQGDPTTPTAPQGDPPAGMVPPEEMQPPADAPDQPAAPEETNGGS